MKSAKTISNKAATVSTNINSISSSMAIEGLETTPTMLEYANDYLCGRSTYEQIINDIVSRYTNEQR